MFNNKNIYINILTVLNQITTLHVEGPCFGGHVAAQLFRNQTGARALLVAPSLPSAAYDATDRIAHVYSALTSLFRPRPDTDVFSSFFFFCPSDSFLNLYSNENRRHMVKRAVSPLRPVARRFVVVPRRDRVRAAIASRRRSPVRLSNRTESPRKRTALCISYIELHYAVTLRLTLYP